MWCGFSFVERTMVVGFTIRKIFRDSLRLCLFILPWCTSEYKMVVLYEGCERSSEPKIVHCFLFAFGYMVFTNHFVRFQEWNLLLLCKTLAKKGFLYCYAAHVAPFYLRARLFHSYDADGLRFNALSVTLALSFWRRKNRTWFSVKNDYGLT